VIWNRISSRRKREEQEEEEAAEESRVAGSMQFRDSRRIIRRVTPLYEIPVLPPPPAVRVPASPPALISSAFFPLLVFAYRVS